MDLYFNIDYRTVYGEEIVLNLFSVSEDGNCASYKYRMSTADGSHWSYRMSVSKNVAKPGVNYFYSVEYAGKTTRTEWLTQSHKLDLSALDAGTCTVYDKWIDFPEDSYLYSSAFTSCVNKHECPAVKVKKQSKTIRLVVRAPQLRFGERLCLIGSAPQLGAWDGANALPMTEQNHNEWTVDIYSKPFEGTNIEFKFVAQSVKEGDVTMWETGYNRKVEVPWMKDGEATVVELGEAYFPVYDTRLAGTLVPVFSLRSKDSFGVGDFGDLKKMIDFMAATNQRVLQVLPINDTTSTGTWEDSYPYCCISIFALHPQYVDLRQLPKLKDEAACKKFEALRVELNSLSQIDYERVSKVKGDYLKAVFEQEGGTVMESREFKDFFAEASSWLVPYAQYSLLRDESGTAEFAKWDGHKTWDEGSRKELSTPTTKAYKKVGFYYFVQFILNKQMCAVHDYARTKGVVLKGDIPIGVNRNGCDVWTEPKYFNLDGQAGAPPDNFSVNGQNWGFPTYNWDAMLIDGCVWWTRRLRNMAKFFDAYRMDHVLGFFRIWEIPANSVQGLLGQFAPALGFTRNEIEAYGLRFQEELFTKPFITDWVLGRVFKEHAGEVSEKYLVRTHDDMYRMKAEYDTQRKVEAAFVGKDGETDVWIRDGLYSLINDVLFVRDHRDDDKFHPRISVQFAFIYEALYDSDKKNFNRIYNDYYYRRNDQFWYNEAMGKLPVIVQATRMLPCAEDLGMVPDCVSVVMDELRILTLEIQSMPKDNHVRFGHLSRNPYRSVCTISTHDMPTLRQWWDEDTGRTQDYYNTMLYRGGAAPHPLPGWLARDIISRHLTCPSMLCIISIQDWLAIDEGIRLADENAERINVPSNPRHYWRYRMHINIEDLTGNAGYVNNISELILESGRKQEYSF